MYLVVIAWIYVVLFFVDNIYRHTRQMQAAILPVVPKPLPFKPASRRCEKNLAGLLTVHHGALPSLP